MSPGSPDVHALGLLGERWDVEELPEEDGRDPFPDVFGNLDLLSGIGVVRVLEEEEEIRDALRWIAGAWQPAVAIPIQVGVRGQDLLQVVAGCAPPEQAVHLLQDQVGDQGLAGVSGMDAVEAEGAAA